MAGLFFISVFPALAVLRAGLFSFAPSALGTIWKRECEFPGVVKLQTRLNDRRVPALRSGTTTNPRNLRSYRVPFAPLGTKSNFPITQLLNYQLRLLFHFHQLSAFGLEVGDNLLLLHGRNKIIMRHFHVEAAAALRHGRKFRSVGQHL
jgi:hypothetical protein